MIYKSSVVDVMTTNKDLNHLYQALSEVVYEVEATKVFAFVRRVVGWDFYFIEYSLTPDFSDTYKRSMVFRALNEMVEGEPLRIAIYGLNPDDLYYFRACASDYPPPALA